MGEPTVLTVEEIVAQLSERGRLEWELAMGRAELVQLRAQLAERQADAAG